MAYQLCISLALGSSKSGIAVLRAQLVDSAGANVGSAIDTGFTEIGAGNYLWNYAAFPDAFRGGVKFYSALVPATMLAFCAVNPQEGEYVDAAISSRLAGTAYTAPDNTSISAIKAKTDLLTTATPTVISAVDGSEITLYRGTTWSINLIVGDVTGNSKIWFTVKDDLNKSDTDSYLQVEKTGGLGYFNGAAGTSSDATLVVNDAATGDITITVKPSTTQSAPLRNALVFDVKVLIGTTLTEKARGTVAVLADVTRAVS